MNQIDLNDIGGILAIVALLSAWGYTWYRFKQQEPQWKKMLGKK
jgi:hypothetical protein